MLFAFEQYLFPRLFQMTGKTGMKPNIVLKDKSVFVRTLRDPPPNFNVRFRNCHLSPGHSDRRFKLVPRRKRPRLRLDKKLI